MSIRAAVRARGKMEILAQKAEGTAQQIRKHVIETGKRCGSIWLRLTAAQGCTEKHGAVVEHSKG